MSFSGRSVLMISVKRRERETEATFKHQRRRQKGKKFFLCVFKSALCSQVHTDHDNDPTPCSEPAGPVGGDVDQSLGKYKSCISAGKNIDAANPHFVGEVITNVVQLAVRVLLGSRPSSPGARYLYPKELCACSACENGAHCLHGDRNEEVFITFLSGAHFQMFADVLHMKE